MDSTYLVDLAENRDMLWVIVNAVMNPRVT
jgi:hypothetical protein